MEEYIYIGKIVNTHGIKGELRLLSDFKYKNKSTKNLFLLLMILVKKNILVIKFLRSSVS